MKSYLALAGAVGVALASPAVIALVWPRPSRIAVARPAIGEVVIPGAAPVTLLPFKPNETMAATGVSVALIRRCPLGVALTAL